MLIFINLKSLILINGKHFEQYTQKIFSNCLKIDAMDIYIIVITFSIVTMARNLAVQSTRRCQKKLNVVSPWSGCRAPPTRCSEWAASILSTLTLRSTLRSTTSLSLAWATNRSWNLVSSKITEDYILTRCTYQFMHSYNERCPEVKVAGTEIKWWGLFRFPSGMGPNLFPTCLPQPRVTSYNFC